MRNDHQKQFQRRVVQLTEELVEEYSPNSRIRKALDQCKTDIIQQSRKIPKNNNII